MQVLPDYDSPTALKAFLDEKGMAMQKKFGQNFLVNRTARERLCDALSFSPGDTVWEVGPGLGAMTDELLRRGAILTAFEIDRGFIVALKDFFSSLETFFLIEGDVLKTWGPAVATRGLPSRFFGNLPYNIAATIIADTISSGIRFETAVFTLQKEVAQRITAKPDSEDYSSFSVLCQWAYDVSSVMDLASGSFWPRPNVASRAIKMTKKKDWPECESPETFLSLLRGLFSSRRKTIKNNFSAWLCVQGYVGEGEGGDNLARALLEEARIDPSKRCETLAVKDFLRLSDTVFRGAKKP